jgi:hypothetical protein
MTTAYMFLCLNEVKNEPMLPADLAAAARQLMAGRHGEAFALQPDAAEVGPRRAVVAVVAIEHQNAQLLARQPISDGGTDGACSNDDDVEPHKCPLLERDRETCSISTKWYFLPFHSPGL